jgi:hypothetical protein
MRKGLFAPASRFGLKIGSLIICRDRTILGFASTENEARVANTKAESSDDDQPEATISSKLQTHKDWTDETYTPSRPMKRP